MEIEARPYQTEAVNSVEKDWAAGVMRALAVCPTGTGKTIIFSLLIKNAVERGKRCLVLAHRGELLDQAASKIKATTGLGCSVEKAEQTSVDSWFFVTVGSVQTMMRESRLKKIDPDRFDYIIVDEAHHVLADSYQTILNHFPKAKILGVTATADRTDRRNLGQYFEKISYEYSLVKAIKDGYLCPIKAQTIPLSIDLTGVSMQNGDFSASDLGNALDPYLHQIADEMLAVGCLERKTVVFLPLVQTSQKFRDILISKGFSAAEVNGNSTDRKEVLRDFDSGRYNVLCNSMLLTEGWDCPSVDCVIVLRPTKSRPLYAQCVGRGTRLSPETGKTELLLLDFLWHTERHELCHPAHLVVGDPDIVRKMTEKVDETGYPTDVLEIVEEATQGVMHDREASLQKELDEMRKKKRKLVDPLQYEMSIADQDLSGYVPAFGWEMGPPSVAQKETLEKMGIFPEDIECAGKASLLLEKLNKRKDEGFSTPRQIRQLENRGFKNVGEWSVQEASNLITRIAANGWKTPRSIDPATYTPASVAETPSFERGA